MTITDKGEDVSTKLLQEVIAYEVSEINLQFEDELKIIDDD